MEDLNGGFEAQNREIIMHEEEGKGFLMYAKKYAREGRETRAKIFPQYIIMHQEADVKENRLGIAHQKARTG